VDQTSRALQSYGVPHGLIAGGRTDNRAQLCQVASVQTLARRLSRFEAPNLLIIDECFPAGTMVDGKPIESIKLGDKVRSHLGTGVVMHLFKKKPSSLVSVKLSNGKTLTCTEEHPIFTQDGFKPAKSLNKNDMMVSIMDYEQLRNLSESNSTKTVQELETGETLRKQRMQGRTFQTDNSEHIHEARRANYQVQENERDAQSTGSSLSFDKTQSNGLEANSQGRKWARFNNLRTCFSSGFGMADECCCSNTIGARKRLADLLQNRRGEFRIESCCGSGRRITSSKRKKRAGCEKGSVFTFHRVESVEVHKQTDCGTFGGLCSDGFVYNLEVSNGNTYFANDFLVHNCHHAAAGTWRRVVDAYPDARVLGVTATPERLDGKGLAGVFDDLIHGPQVAELIDRGFLARPKYWSKPLMNTESMRVSMGDYAVGDLEAALTNAVMGDAVTEYRQKSDGLPAIAFCPTIAKARAVSDAFCAAGYAWDVIDGTLTPADRRELVAKLGDGRLHGLSACEIVSEGFDLPVVTTAILLRPTKSLGLHLQQVGRVLRLHPSKTHAIILDHAGNLHRHGLAEDPREWSLDGRPKAKKGAPAPTKTCPQCFCCLSPAVRVCPECQHEFEVKEAKLREVAGSLVEFSREEVKLALKKARTLADFQEIGKQMGYKPGWAHYRFNARNTRPTYSYKL
jgi:superfamily II DNA or RNA helicase